MMPSLSIIIPLFNKAPYIELTLRAFGSQLGPTDEILIVDDQSTDGGAEVARSVLAGTTNPGRIITLRENSGPATARNIGARESKCSHLLFFDADDIPLPNLLRTLRSAIEEHPKAVAFAYQIAFQARNETAPTVETDDSFSATLRPRHAFVLDSLKGKVLCTASSTCVSRDAFFAAGGGFSEGLRYCEDPEFWARLSAEHQILEIHRTLAIYRDVPTSLSYGHRVRPGAVNPYVNGLRVLAKQHGSPYLRLARSMVFKNLVFSRASGASYIETSEQLIQHKQCLGQQKYLQLRCFNMLPSIVFRKALEYRLNRIAHRQRRRKDA